MRLITTIEEMREVVHDLKKSGKTIGFVPTMGYLHAGHATLIDRARTENDVVVVSIFVNPLQFGPQEDYASYPRDLERDSAICQEHGVDFVFAPSSNVMYPKGTVDVFVDVRRLDQNLCGRFRPGHFRGVLTVVMKLFNIVQPDRAYFGMKDIQQLRIIEEMVNDLNWPVQIVAVPTVREDSGLAMSSRNTYLSEEERKTATAIYQSLQMARQLIEAGERDASAICDKCIEFLERVGLRVQYFQVVDYDSLQLLRTVSGKVIVGVAAFVGKARLIDNVVLEVS